jgi:hypothetical protein
MQDANDLTNRHLAENEEIIARTIRILQFKDPANANREYAVELLKRMQQVAKTIAGKSPLSFEEYIDLYLENN